MIFIYLGVMLRGHVPARPARNVHFVKSGVCGESKDPANPIFVGIKSYLSSGRAHINAVSDAALSASVSLRAREGNGAIEAAEVQLRIRKSVLGVLEFRTAVPIYPRVRPKNTKTPRKLE